MNFAGRNPTDPMAEMLMLRKDMGARELKEQIVLGRSVEEMTAVGATIAVPTGRCGGPE